MGGLAALAASAFLAATLLPGSSEAVLVALVAAGRDPWPLWLVATLANSAGSAVNWVLGQFLVRFQDRRWFPASPAQVERAGRVFRRWGAWSLLFAWLPVVGDALTVVAGAARFRIVPFLLLVAAGKGARYAAVLGALGLVR